MLWRPEDRRSVGPYCVTQGLLDLEGDSLTPILVSLVKKDAHMLDAFGKGASEDIRLAKQVQPHVLTRQCGTCASLACQAAALGAGL